MNFSTYLNKRSFLLEQEELYPKANPTALKTTMRLPVEIMKLAAAFDNDGLKDIQHELKHPGTPNKLKIGKDLADLDANSRKELIAKGVLNVTGRTLYVHGGAVRDHAINLFHGVARMPEDYDLCTDASPEALKLIIQQGIKDKILSPETKIKQHDKKFGNFEIIFPEDTGEEEDIRVPQTYEITTFPFTDHTETGPMNMGRMLLHHRKGRFNVDSLLYDIQKGEIVDLGHGLADISRGRVGSTNGKLKIKEDPSNALIYVNRHAMMNQGDLASIEDDAKENLRGISLKDVKPEELRKNLLNGIKTARNRSNYVKILYDLGILQQIFPSLPVNGKIKNSKVNIPALTIAQILQMCRHNGDLFGILKKMSFRLSEIKDILFLVNLPYYRNHQVQDFIEGWHGTGLSAKTIEEYAELVNAPNLRLIRHILDGKDENGLTRK